MCWFIEEVNQCPLSKEKRKRKRPGVSSGESESDEDLVNMDLENYLSEEDPDYEVRFNPSFLKFLKYLRQQYTCVLSIIIENCDHNKDFQCVRISSAL